MTDLLPLLNAALLAAATPGLTVDLTAVIGVLAGITVIGGGIAAALVAIRKWIRGVAAPAQYAAQQLSTPGDQTVGQQVDNVADKVGELKEELTVLNRWEAQNRDMAIRALALAQQAADRLDAHLKGHD